MDRPVSYTRKIRPRTVLVENTKAALVSALSMIFKEDYRSLHVFVITKGIT
jgi:hypothetical protein